jgi:Zn-dependent M28 family amino/carboxypeptidase
MRALPLRAIALLALLASAPVGAQQPAPQLESIRSDQLRADLFFLAGESLRGRLTNTPGNAVAVDWIKSRFERLGLKGPADGSYYQRYNLMAASLGSGNRLEATLSSGVSLAPQAGQSFYPLRHSANGTAAGPLVFVGYGITSPAVGHDDYRGAQVRGSVVLALLHEPGENDPQSPFDGVVTHQQAGVLEKTLAAQAKGAVGILFVSDVQNHPAEINFEAEARNYWPETPPRVERYTLAAWSDRVAIPALQISPALAEQLIAASGKRLAELAGGAETRGGATSVPIPGARVEMTAAVVHHVIPDRNVVGLIEGSDPTLKDEWVVICAHVDHEGADGNGVFAGADDDGSGTVAVLEIAEAYALAAEAGQRPRRSVLFAVWNSEERGLLGAWAYTERPLHPLARTVAVLNMDMVGRNEEVPIGEPARFRGLEVQTAASNANATNVLGYSRAPELYQTIERANRAIGLELKPRYDNNTSQLLRRSDHWPFLQRGVPAVWFHTGLHPDYHRVSDIPEKIEYGKMEKIARLVYQASWDLANQQGRPKLATEP